MLLTRVVVIRTKQIIGLKLGSCFLLMPAAAACLSTNNLITELGSACSHTQKQTHTPADTLTHRLSQSYSELELYSVELTPFVVVFIVTVVIQWEQRQCSLVS